METHDVALIVVGLTSLIAAVLSFINGRKIQEVHVALNSRLTELLTSSSDLARAQGMASGRSEGRRDTADARNKVMIDTM